MKTKLNTFFWLLWRDVLALRKTFFSQWVNYSCSLSLIVIFNANIMPTFGLPATFGVYMFISQAVASLLWVISSDVSSWAYDLHGPKAISYELTLPISYQLVYLKYATAYAIKAMAINLASMPVAAIFVVKSIDFSAISPLKFLAAYVLSSLFFALFDLCVVVLYTSIEAYNHFWMRWGMVIWMFSGLFAPWHITYKTSAYAGYATLLNPFIYVYEGAHAAFMGQGQFINFWICCTAVMCFGTLLAFVGMQFFKKRLDCV